MAAITAAMVKELRDKTNAGMMDCKEALQEAKGDLEAAETILRKKGIKAAEKKAGREAKEGIVASRILKDGAGILVEVNCETDFVAKNENFKKLVEQVLDQIEASKETSDLQALLGEAFVGDPKQKFQDFFKAKVGELGENMMIARFVKFPAKKSMVGDYIHPPGRVGVLIEASIGNAKSAKNETLKKLLKDVAMQVAAATPLCVDRDGVPANLLEAEKDIFREQMKDKPADKVEKIIVGKLGKFYSQTCLLEQAFVKDQEKTIRDLVKETAKAAGDEKLAILRFVRYAVGEGSAS